MIGGVHHVALRTRDMARLEAFYRDLLGLVARARDGERSVWLSAGDTIVMLERAAEGEPGVSPLSMDLVAFRIPASSRADYMQRLSSAGALVEGETQFTIYFRDPDGRRIGLSHYPDEHDA